MPGGAETIEGRSRPERRDPSNCAWRFRTIQSFCGTINMNSSGSHVHNSAHHGKTITRQRSREAFYQHKMPHNANVPKHKTGRSAHHGAFTLASHGGGHHAAGHLVERMYSRRGLNISAHRDDHIDPNRLVITAGTEEQVFGTMTLGFDHAEGLLAEARYAEQINALRSRGLGSAKSPGLRSMRAPARSRSLRHCSSSAISIVDRSGA